MHILFLTDNFPPESNAPASRTYEHAREWVKSGAEVTVITCAPNFPEGKLYEGYSNLLHQQENVDGITVIRVKTYITANDGFLLRTLDYLSFMLSSFLAGLFVRKVSLVIATSPQFFTACAGWLLSVFKRKPFVFELRDIWPASIKAVGVSQDGVLLRALEKIELFLYRRADLIVSVTHSFKFELAERGISPEKISVVTNGVDRDFFAPVREKDRDLLEKYDLRDRFIVGYIGTHGLAHSLDTLIEAASMFQETEDVVFLFAGSGAALAGISDKVITENIDNVRILGRQSKSDMPRIWGLCDVAVIHLRNKPLFGKVIPSKIFECMAMGLPMIAGLPKGEATDIIESREVGLVVPPENPKALMGAINTLRADTQQIERLSANSLKASEDYSRQKQARLMLNALFGLVAE